MTNAEKTERLARVLWWAHWDGQPPYEWDAEPGRATDWRNTAIAALTWLDSLENDADNAVCDERADGPFVPVDLAELAAGAADRHAERVERWKQDPAFKEAMRAVPGDLIAERDALQAKVREMAMQNLADLGQAQEAWEAQKAAEAERDALRAEVERLQEERNSMVSDLGATAFDAFRDAVGGKP